MLRSRTGPATDESSPEGEGEDLFAQAEADKSAAAKSLRVELEREHLLRQLGEGLLDDVKVRVAFLLNHYPQTRNSDHELVVKFWKAFHPGLAGDSGINYDSMRQVTPYPSIVRARAKIQNTYRLFLADDAVRIGRVELDEVERKKQRHDRPGTPFTHIYCDESGKSQDRIIVGSVWINDGAEGVREVFQRLGKWKRDAGMTGELHFKGAFAGTKDRYIDFVREAVSSSEFLGFKAVVVPKLEVSRRPVDEAVFELHYRLVVEGIRHEVRSGRFDLPRALVIHKDKDEGADVLYLKNLRDRLDVECPNFDNQVVIQAVEGMDSKASILMQLADVLHRLAEPGPEQAAGRGPQPQGRDRGRRLGNPGLVARAGRGPENERLRQDHRVAVMLP